MSNNTNAADDYGWNDFYYYGYPRRYSVSNLNRHMNERNRDARNLTPLNILNTIVRGYNLNMLEYQNNIHNLINDVQTLNMYANTQTNINGPSSVNDTQSESMSSTVHERPFSERSVPPHLGESVQERSGAADFQSMTASLLSYIVQPPSSYASTEWITRGTEELVYSASMGELVCPITMDLIGENDVLTRIRFCGHTFKKNALSNWFSRNTRCPVCRHDLATSTTFDLSGQNLSIPESNTNTTPSTNRTSASSSLDTTVRSLSRLFQNLNVDSVRYDPSGLLLFEFDLPL